ncbi:MAG: hypothetical protein M3494_04680 [Actinomycetota bacterium]|nr:hypothetical protein [Actinomycetota bacterium]
MSPSVAAPLREVAPAHPDLAKRMLLTANCGHREIPSPEGSCSPPETSTVDE